MTVVSLQDKFSRVTEFWSPKIVGELNGSYVKIGRLCMQFRDGNQDVGPGEFIVIPRGVEHCPLALTDEVRVVLIEPKTTRNTGNVRQPSRAMTPPD